VHSLETIIIGSGVGIIKSVVVVGTSVVVVIIDVVGTSVIMTDKAGLIIIPSVNKITSNIFFIRNLFPL